MVDMATRYREYPSKDSDFSGIRDSFYILSVMNQYTINPKMRKAAKAAEKLLRIALFDESLKVDGLELVKLREHTASSLRKSRKRGVVAVFISMGWFLFSLAISIQAGMSPYLISRHSYEMRLTDAVSVFEYWTNRTT